MFRIGVLAAIALAIAGCATPIKVSLTEEFDATQAAALLQPGDNVIRGSALIRQNGGGVVTCAGVQVTMIPATLYAQQRLAVLYGSHIKAYRGTHRYIHEYIFEPNPPEFGKLMRSTICNAQGNFTFDSVADGEFMVVVGITWNVGGHVQGGYLLQSVRVQGGENKEIVLSP